MKQYNFTEKIGEGAFAQVWRVTDETGKVYACKKSRNRKLLKQEAEYMRTLKMPVFPRFYEYRETEREGRLFMELIEGSSLTEWVLNEENELTAGSRQKLREQIMQIGLGLAEGLEPLQEREPALVYRDLKPDNIMIAKDGKVRIVDLGLICPEGARGDRGGSPGCAAPEQFEQGAEITGRADVYAWGKVMEWLMVNCCKEMEKQRRHKLISRRAMRNEATQDMLIQMCGKKEAEARLHSMRFVRDVLRNYSSEENTMKLSNYARDVLRGRLIVRKSVVKTGGKS